MSKRLFLSMSVMLLFVMFLAAQVMPTGVTAETLPGEYDYGYDSIEIPTPVNLNVTIQVNGGANSPADCTVHVVDSLANPVAGSPASGSSSYTFSLIPGTYTVSQDPLTGYDTTIDGSSGYSETITLNSDGGSVTIVNTAVEVIPPPNPHITVAKTGNSSSLPYGGGSVTYTYTVTNDGNVPLYIDSIVDNTIPTFGSSNYVSGDNSNIGILDPDESWVYTATAAISATVTNTVTVSSSYLSSESSATHESTATDRTPLDPVSASFTVTVDSPVTGGGGDGLNVGTPETVSVPETPQVTTPQVPETPKVTTPQVPPTVVTPEPVVVPVVTPKMPNTGVHPVGPVVGWTVAAGICLAILFIAMVAKRKGLFSSCK